MNYIKIINWFWDEVPHFENFKPYHVSLFFALLDSINRNKWQPTRIAYEYLITKCGLAKRSYLESRDWLVKNELIEVVPGKNSYQMASFSLGVAVQNCTTTDTTISTTTAPLLTPLCAPNNKHINKKQLNIKQEEKNIKEREADFFKEVMAYEGKYEQALLENFFNYWSEYNQTETKMAFEMKKTFQINKRLATWKNRNPINFSQQNSFSNGAGKEGTSQKRIGALSSWVNGNA